MSVNEELNDELISKALITLRILLDDNDPKVRLQAAKQLLDGTIFKKNVNTNNLIISMDRKEISSGMSILKEIADGIEDGEVEYISTGLEGEVAGK